MFCYSEGEARIEFMAEEVEEEDVESKGGEGEEYDEGFREACEGGRENDGDEEQCRQEVCPPGGKEPPGVVDGDGDGITDFE